VTIGSCRGAGVASPAQKRCVRQAANGACGRGLSRVAGAGNHDAFSADWHWGRCGAAG
jgi:hypothetical protein